MDDFEKEVKEQLDMMYEREEGDLEGQADDVEVPADEPEDNVKDDDWKSEEKFSAKDFDEFLDKTGSEVEIESKGKMPSPIFGPRDTHNHNKYLVRIRNGKGDVKFTFWDSIANTEAGKPLDRDAALASFGLDLQAFEENPTQDEFTNAFGYDEAEEALARKAYNGCRKTYASAIQMFNSDQINELVRLASEF